jgi:dihydrofolate synthase/folylpolyglutamate synthase
VSPVAAAIVSIDFDHQEQLGNTLASIAAEKAGVIKPGIPVVCGPVPAEALQVIAAVCAERRATLILTDTDGRLGARIASMTIGLPGEHQKTNAAVALRLLEAIDEDQTLGLRVGADAMRAGLAEVRWPGRLESFTVGGCRVLIDAAHNAAGARALAAHLLAVAPGGVTLVFGAMQDKAITEMLSALAPVVVSVVCTAAPNPRAMTADELVLLASSLGLRAEAIPDPVSAVGHACASGGPVVVAGSIFLIGPVREWLARDILR